MEGQKSQHLVDVGDFEAIAVCPGRIVSECVVIIICFQPVYEGEKQLLDRFNFYSINICSGFGVRFVEVKVFLVDLKAQACA